MNKADANAKEVKLLGNGGMGAIPRLPDGKTSPKRLITAGEKAMLRAAEADAALKRYSQPPTGEKGPAKEGDQLKEEASGWTKVVGHAF
jgi:hypothetical protein